MEWGMIGAMAEAIGALGVIISLIYLSAQVRQNTRIAEASYHIQERANYRNLTLGIIENEDVAEIFYRGLLDPESLATVKYQRFAFMMGEFFQHYQAQWAGARAGLVLPELERASAQWTASLIRMPGGRKHWNQLRPMFPEEVQERLEEMLEHTPPADEIFPDAFTYPPKQDSVSAEGSRSDE